MSKDAKGNGNGRGTLKRLGDFLFGRPELHDRKQYVTEQQDEIKQRLERVKREAQVWQRRA